MPDYTSILRRSISALPDAAPAMREAVYQRARAALARQLTAVDPPLSSREIEAQHQQLESAVALIEAEYAPEGDYDNPAPAPSAPVLAAEPYRPNRPAPVQAFSREAAADADVDPTADRDDIYDRDDEYDDEEEPSRAPLIITLVVLALVLIGGGALVYAQRDLVAEWTGLPIGSQQAALAPPAAEPVEVDVPAAPAPIEPMPTAAEAEESDKLPDRLTNGEAVADLEPEIEADVAEPAAVDDPLSGAEQAQAPAGIGADAIETPAPLVPAPAEAGTPPAAAPAAGQSLVAQRAIFYEQGTDDAPGQAWQGTVAWSQVPRPDGSTGVQATLQLPDQNVTATISILKNSDETLPASHLVEIEFSGEGRLGEAEVERVPALVLKPNEQARGQPLSGAAVPVTEKLFWIALSSEDEQVERNLALLRDGSWFDLPILFVGGQRALITFEKGIPGDKVFEAVLAGWAP